LESVAIMKSVPNWILYSHDFSQIFTCCLAIFLRWNPISGLFQIRIPLARGAHLSVTLSPGVVIPLAIVGGALLPHAQA
jgi:hypothetical protein